MVLVIWAGVFRPGWCRKHPEIWSGDRFLNILGVDNLRNNFFACKSNDCFKKNYSKRLRQPCYQDQNSNLGNKSDRDVICNPAVLR